MSSGLIYEPQGRAREYAALACNIYSGCDHRCVYCYAPSATRRDRAAFAQPTTRRDFLANLEREAAKHQAAGVSGQVLLCFTCDPYQFIDIETGITRQTIRTLHRHGFTVCALTKGGSRALRDLDLFGPDDAFATTLTLLDPTHSAQWEPGAASPTNRIETIHQFHSAGIPTWVSLEPVLNPSVALQIIRETHSFVDLYKVGKLNYHQLAQTINWRAFTLSAVSLLDSIGVPYYIKRDLAAYLPNGVAPNAVALDTIVKPCATTKPQLSMF